MTADDVTLTEAEREVLLDVNYAYANPFDDDNPTPEWLGVVATVERILADRLAAVQADLADARGSLDMALASARDRLARAEVARRRLAEVEALAEQPATNYPDDCPCSHGMGFQFHTYPCRFAADIPKTALRAALANPPAVVDQ